LILRYSNGRVTYSWSGGSTPNTANNSLDASGIYIVTVTAANGCSDTAGITITHAPTAYIGSILSLPSMEAFVPVTTKGFSNIGSFSFEIQADQNISSFTGLFDQLPILTTSWDLYLRFYKRFAAYQLDAESHGERSNPC
jgi:hypothetical protein